jgi:hypothetical protein
MDIKDLNKPQLILLMVLLSFVTSIATGITTVTLMQQAPPSFTEPVNRVIRQTVENIQQVEGKTITQTIIVKEEDLIVDAIEKNKGSVFAVSKDGFDLEGRAVELPAGRAFAVTADGILVADASLVFENEVHYVKNESGKFRAQFVSANIAGFALIKIGNPVNGTDKPVFTVPVFGDLEKMKIGQKMIVWGSGVASSIFEGDKNLNMSVSRGNAGGLVLNLNGEALGVALFNETTNFAPIKTITDALSALGIIAQ